MTLLERRRFHLLSKEDAAAGIDMNLFNTDPGDARVYHALIADDGVVPQVLFG